MHRRLSFIIRLQHVGLGLHKKLDDVGQLLPHGDVQRVAPSRRLLLLDISPKPHQPLHRLNRPQRVIMHAAVVNRIITLRTKFVHITSRVLQCNSYVGCAHLHGEVQCGAPVQRLSVDFGVPLVQRAHAGRRTADSYLGFQRSEHAVMYGRVAFLVFQIAVHASLTQEIHALCLPRVTRDHEGRAPARIDRVEVDLCRLAACLSN
mmetsp:Transcript_2466/g.5941  ORF Transcript_2466/g.5941 Transcript_2466/m.5941 type:complete len:205 (-) Transcript_2466:19-633(-)